MRKALNLIFLAVTATSCFAGVTITSPTNGSTVASPVHVIASAVADSGKPISSVIIYLDNVNVYSIYSNKVDTYLPVGNGTHTILVKSWDSGGTIYQQSVVVNVASSSAITLSSPAPGSTVSSPTRFLASAKSLTAYPIASMILYVDNTAMFLTYSSSMDTTQSLVAGNHSIIIKSWDSGGNIYQLPFTISVSASTTVPTYATVFDNLDQALGWQSCDTCAGAGGTGPTAPHSLTQRVASPSLDGASAQFWMGGTTAYSDVLWWDKLLTSTQVTQNRALHSFVYDLYFYMDNPTVAQSLEWDVNQFIDGQSFIFGSQCSYRARSTWDIWDNINSHWISTGVICPIPQAYSWNHVVLEFERTSDNRLHYIAMTMNGVKHYLNWYYYPTSTTWSGVTVNYQMDGDYRQDNYSTWVDKMKLSTW